MTLQYLIFRYDILTIVKYTDLIFRLKKRLDKTFYTGQIDNEKTILYYDSDMPIKKLNLARLPLTQIEVNNKLTDQGQLLIKFKINNFPLIFVGAGLLCIWIAFIADWTKMEITSPIFATVFFYFFLQFSYLIELSNFKSDIKEIEKEIQSNAL